VFEAERRYQRQLGWLKRWIWIYFWLLIFEGALRKWILPSLSGPLLLTRDPVAIILYVQAYRCGKFSMDRMWPFAVLALGIGLLAGAQVAADINTIPVALYGLRSYLLHLPLMFVIADTLEEEDLHKLGRWLLLLSIPMTLLVLVQYSSGSGTWINAGAGEDAGQILSTGGHVRPAGTFSYGTGMQCLEGIVAGFILDALMRKGRYPRWLVWLAMASLVIAIPALGSRSVLFTMAVLVVFTMITGASHGERLVDLVKISAVVLLVGVLALQLPIFNRSVETMTERWQQASNAEGGVQDVLHSRIFGVIEDALESASTTPWLGRGIGMGSNFAAVSQTGGATFLLGESEWARVVPEFGPILGLLFMGARVGLGAYITVQAVRALKRNAPLAWLLVPGIVPQLVLSIMEQPTYLGFMVFGAGICMAAARTGDSSMYDGSFDAV
jgi:hypothetical protein